MTITSTILETAAIAVVAFWTLGHVQGSADFSDGMAGVLVGLLLLWGVAWWLPDSSSIFDRSIERRKRVFGEGS